MPVGPTSGHQYFISFTKLAVALICKREEHSSAIKRIHRAQELSCNNSLTIALASYARTSIPWREKERSATLIVANPYPTSRKILGG